MKKFIFIFFVAFFQKATSLPKRNIDPQALSAHCGRPDGAVTLSILVIPKITLLVEVLGIYFHKKYYRAYSGEYCVTATNHRDEVFPSLVRRWKTTPPTATLSVFLRLKIENCDSIYLRIDRLIGCTSYLWYRTKTPVIKISTTGFYSVTITDQVAGCTAIDSVAVNQVLQKKLTNLMRTICSGDSVTVGNRVFKISGFYSVTLIDQYLRQYS